jgi:rsbT co-antagonist protein RsbR
VYNAHFREVIEAGLAAMESQTVQAETILDEWEQERSLEATRSMVCDALLDGRWTPFLDVVLSIGRQYARAGLPFGVWSAGILALRVVLGGHIARTYRDDLERLTDCLAAMEAFADRMLVTLAEGYMSEREDMRVIRQLSTPVLRLRPGLVVLPIIGAIDPTRAQQLTSQFLTAAREQRALVAIVDVTGIPIIDSGVAYHLLQALRAGHLMGTRIVLTGLSAPNAQVLTELGVDLADFVFAGDLQEGFAQADVLLGDLGRRVPATG